jgi:SAM-dependent methyltransferase
MTDPNRQNQSSTWAMGDYPAMAQRLVDVAVAAVDVADIRPGHTVLDVGTGTGNAAVLAARAGAAVTGVDPTPELLQLAARRAHEENLTIGWQHGEAEHLDAADRSFDRVLSVFGVMYAPNPATAAKEVLRCCRPGGRIVVTAWTPDSFMATTNRAIAPYLPPPPPGGTPPTQWGNAGFIHTLFGSSRTTICTTLATVRFEFPTIDAAKGSGLEPLVTWRQNDSAWSRKAPGSDCSPTSNAASPTPTSTAPAASWSTPPTY